MNNNNFYKDKKQSIQFEKKINHLQSFIGMPMWNGRNPTLAEIREYDRRLIEKQALDFKVGEKSIFSRFSKKLKQQFLKSLNNYPKIKPKSKVKILERDIAQPIKPEAGCCY